MYGTVRTHIASAARLYRVHLESLPDYWADEDCDRYRTNLNAVFGQGSSDIYCLWAADKSGGEQEEDSDEGRFLYDGEDSDEEAEDDCVMEEEARVAKKELVSRFYSTQVEKAGLSHDNRA